MIRIFQTAEGSRLYGENAGGYPVHRFFYPAMEPPAPEWPLQAVFGGEDENTAGCWRARENSDLFSLELVTAGIFAFTEFGRREECGPGDLFLVQIGADSRMECLTPGTRKRTISMAGTALLPLLNSFGLRKTAVLRGVRRSGLDPLFDRMFLLFREKPEHYEAECSTLCYRILLELSDCRKRGGLPPPLAELLAYIGRNYAERLTPARLAARCGISPTTLFRLFRTHLGQSPKEYIIRLRMRHARTLLLEGELPVKEIAGRVGYDNPLYFSSEFHRVCGDSPRDFRRKNLSY